MTSKSNKDIIIIALKLLVICAVVALIVSTVNFITKDRILLNEKQNTAVALTGIFSQDFGGLAFTVEGDEYVIRDNDMIVADCTAAECTLNKDVNALYVIKDAYKIPLFYCVSISPMGFKSQINMLVAVNPDLTVKGVEIVSMSETSGIGTKAQDKAFLSKFSGKTENQASEVDIITGATKTSKPIIEAVANALNQVAVYKSSLGGEQ
ncbi:MAG: FMN-binding protein [Clostridia bacterium]|nr:FMN-binding protein [Clostridia bacterium]